MSGSKLLGKASGTGVGIILALFVGIGFGAVGPVSQLGVGAGFSISQLVFMQFLVSALFLGFVVMAKGRTASGLGNRAQADAAQASAARLGKTDVAQLVALGVANAAATACSFLAIDYLSVSAAIAIQFQYVWIAVVFQAIFTRALPDKWTVVSSVLVIVGALFGSGLFEEFVNGGITMSPIGLTFAAICAVLYAVFIYFNGQVATEAAPASRSFIEAIGCLAFASVFLAVTGDAGFDNAGESPLAGMAAALPYGAIMGMVGAALPILALVSASQKLPGGVVAVLTATELPTAVFAGFAILGEAVSPLTLLGIVIILAAVAVGQMDGAKEAELAPADAWDEKAATGAAW